MFILLVVRRGLLMVGLPCSPVSTVTSRPVELQNYVEYATANNIKRIHCPCDIPLPIYISKSKGNQKNRWVGGCDDCGIYRECIAQIDVDLDPNLL